MRTTKFKIGDLVKRPLNPYSKEWKYKHGVVIRVYDYKLMWIVDFQNYMNSMV